MAAILTTFGISKELVKNHPNGGHAYEGILLDLQWEDLILIQIFEGGTHTPFTRIPAGKTHSWPRPNVGKPLPWKPTHSTWRKEVFALPLPTSAASPFHSITDERASKFRITVHTDRQVKYSASGNK